MDRPRARAGDAMPPAVTNGPPSSATTALLDGVSRPRLILGMLLTGVLALGVHAVMLDQLHVPYPGFKVDAPLAQFVSRGFLHVLGLIWLARSIDARLRDRSFLVRSAVLFLLASMLTEALFRGPFMNGYCSDSYVFVFAGAVPTWATEAVLCALIVASRRWTGTPVRAIAAAIALGALSTAVLRPAAAQASASVEAALAALSHPGWCELPYGWNVNLPAYLTFIEPVLAAFGIAALVWDALPTTPWQRLIAFTLLVMMIRRQLIAAFVYMAYSDLPPWTGLASMGQFSLEALALGLLTGLSWRWAWRGGDPPGSTPPLADQLTGVTSARPANHAATLSITS